MEITVRKPLSFFSHSLSCLTKPAIFAIFFPIVFRIVFFPNHYFGNSTLDPFHYLALFLNYQDPGFMPNGYKLSRITWVLLGHFSYSFFPPWVAFHLLSVGLLIAIQSGFYSVTKLLFGSPTAVAGTVIFGLNGFLINYAFTSGGLYHNFCGIAFYLWSFFFFIKAVRHDGKNYFLMSGIFYTLSVFSQTILLNFFPLFFLFLFYKKEKTKHNLFLYFFIGCFSITLLLTILHAAFRKGEFFLTGMIRLLARYASHPALEQAWYHPWKTLWFLFDPGLILIVSTTLIAIVLLAKKNSAGLSRQQIVIGLQIILSFFILLFWQILHHHVLNYSYIYFPIIVPASLALCGFLSQSRLFHTKHAYLVISIALSFFIFIRMNDGLDFIQNLLGMYTFLILSGLLVLSVLIIVFFRKPKFAALFLVIFGICNAFLFTRLEIPKTLEKETLNIAYRAISYISKLVPYNRIAIWYDVAEEKDIVRWANPYITATIANPWVGCSSCLDDFQLEDPQNMGLTKGMKKMIGKHFTIVLLAQNLNTIDQMEKQMSLRFGNEGATLVRYVDLPFEEKNIVCHLRVLKFAEGAL